MTERRREGLMRTVIGVAAAIAVCAATACTGPSTSPPPPVRSASAVPSPGALPAGTTSLNCSSPIDVVSSPPAPYSSTLDVVSLDTTSTLQAGRAGGADPHRLFAKVGLLVHAGQESTLTVPSAWASRVSIAWGNQAADWTNSLHIPACPKPSWAAGQWLVFPGGFSLDTAACVPLEVHAASRTTVIYASVGARC
jgi:hypothetical protein